MSRAVRRRCKTSRAESTIDVIERISSKTVSPHIDSEAVMEKLLRLALCMYCLAFWKCCIEAVLTRAGLTHGDHGVLCLVADGNYQSSVIGSCETVAIGSV